MRRIVLLAIGMLLLGACAWIVVQALHRQVPATAPASAPVAPAVAGTPRAAAEEARIEQQVRSFCGGCHVVPRPEDFSRTAWRKEVQQGFDLYFQSARNDLQVPLFTDILSYYEQRAPESLELPPTSTGVDFGGLAFTQTQAPQQDSSPAVAHIKMLDDAAGVRTLMVCDMRSGKVSKVVPRREAMQLTQIAQLNNPSHLEACDLDGDGRQDFVVCDLGSFRPGDHDKGRVVWLKPQQSGYETHVLAQSIGRVADAEPIDVDNDQDEDLVVAVFGWRRSGEIVLLNNEGPQDGPPAFTSHVLDPRHGAIHVPVVDMNGDGKADFFAVFGQDYEAVELFTNEGDSMFRTQRLFAAPTPAFGSSGMRITDLDGDGDIDVLYTNGDMFDDIFLRTQHAVHWLENLGADGWQHHELAKLPGVHRALEADFDGEVIWMSSPARLCPQRWPKNIPRSNSTR